jgi:hypothetical protein
MLKSIAFCNLSSKNLVIKDRVTNFMQSITIRFFVKKVYLNCSLKKKCIKFLVFKFQVMSSCSVTNKNVYSNSSSVSESICGSGTLSVLFFDECKDLYQW